MLNNDAVKCDFLDAIGFWHVVIPDPEYDNGPENPGKVVAYIDDLTGRVLYMDNHAMSNDVLKETIDKKVNEKVKDILNNSKVLIRRDSPTQVSLNIKTALGTLTAETDPGSLRYDEGCIYIGCEFHSGNPFVYSDLVAAGVSKKGLEIFSYDDLYDECYQRKTTFYPEQIKELVEFCN